jgi:pimeloyl-ACP methyl ester carboxylesterase
MNRREFRGKELAAICCPTLIITGEDDTAQPPANSKSLIDGIRGARHVNIPGAGHSSSLETPEAVIAAMQEFLQRRTKPL